MNHGGGGNELFAAPSSQSGPRQPLQLGLDSARATQNILRLLESSTHDGAIYSDTLDMIWHDDGLVWTCNNDGEWKAVSPMEAQQAEQSTKRSLQSAPTLQWLNMSDDRTALARIQGMDGVHSYVSMLRLDAPVDVPSMMVANDGWQIVRQVNGNRTDESSIVNNIGNTMSSINCVLIDYLSIEHGGGKEDKQRSAALFAPQASLLSVGTSPHDEPPTDWSAPSGSFFEVSLSTYLQGVSSQAPHFDESKAHDAIVSIDVLPCQTAAAATVHVGNGAQTNVFVDHLLLGWYGKEDRWKILSKTFTPRAWPDEC